MTVSPLPQREVGWGKRSIISSQLPLFFACFAGRVFPRSCQCSKQPERPYQQSMNTKGMGAGREALRGGAPSFPSPPDILPLLSFARLCDLPCKYSPFRPFCRHRHCFGFPYVLHVVTYVISPVHLVLVNIRLRNIEESAFSLQTAVTEPLDYSKYPNSSTESSLMATSKYALSPYKSTIT